MVEVNNKNNMPILAIIVPCFNEEDVIKDSADKLINKLKMLVENQAISSDSYISFIDDGSIDKTWELLLNIAQENQNVKLIKFLNNFGHQKAIMCGMCENRADIYITIDCDLQDDINAIDEMIEKYKTQDIEVVYGVRKDRSIDSVSKRMLAQSYYKFISFMGVKTIPDSADFRLVSDNVVNMLRNIKEQNLYLRGLISNLGFKYDLVYYDRKERLAGVSKYPIRKQLALALDGIISLSKYPVKFIFLMAIIFITIGIFDTDKIFFVGGTILFSIWIIGEYIVRLSFDIKNRPNWIIDKKINY